MQVNFQLTLDNICRRVEYYYLNIIYVVPSVSNVSSLYVFLYDGIFQVIEIANCSWAVVTQTAF